MTERKRVLITGAGGKIGGSLAVSLKDRYALRLHYHHPPEVTPDADYVTADVSKFDEMISAMQGIDAVVHLAGSPHVTSPWESVHQTNIIGTYNVFESARLAGVRKIVFASTNHVMGMYDRDREWPVYADQPVRPDSLYGVSKAFGESLGRHYADQYGIVGRLVAHRLVSGTPARRDRALDVAQPARLCPDRLALDRERHRLRGLLCHLSQQRTSLGYQRRHPRSRLPAAGRRGTLLRAKLNWRGENVKITDLKCALIGSNPIVRVVTDEGINGYGEVESYKPYLKPHVLFYRDALIGEDPTNVERVMLKIRRFGAFKPWGSAVSAIEMALWDIAGKAASLPVYKLLGGKIRDRVRVYNGAVRFPMPATRPTASPRTWRR